MSWPHGTSNYEGFQPNQEHMRLQAIYQAQLNHTFWMDSIAASHNQIAAEHWAATYRSEDYAGLSALGIQP